MPDCLIALGGNRGNVARTFRDALQLLQQYGIACRTMSHCYTTRPIGVDSGGSFLNAAALLQTEQSPEELLARLLQVEEYFGRTRQIPWGPRPLDLDLILWEEEIIETATLTVPHPAAWYRRFVLDPVVEIAPSAWHPLLMMSMTDLRHRMMTRPLPIRVTAANQRLVMIMQERFKDQITLVETDPVIELIDKSHARPEEWPPFAIDISSVSNQIQYAADVLMAALDEPRRT